MIDFLKSMSSESARIPNYVVPGLTSLLLDRGKVRMFESSRNTEEFITPHSHRYDFHCLVLSGTVRNTRYLAQTGLPPNRNRESDFYMRSRLSYGDAPGKYTLLPGLNPTWFSRSHDVFVQGEWYSMKHDEIHSITFERDAVVLFFEGPVVSNITYILEPFVDGGVINTFKVSDWMYK